MARVVKALIDDEIERRLIHGPLDLSGLLMSPLSHLKGRYHDFMMSALIHFKFLGAISFLVVLESLGIFSLDFFHEVLVFKVESFSEK